MLLPAGVPAMMINSSERFQATIIEPDDCTACSPEPATKRQRTGTTTSSSCDCSSLNLLLRAIDEQQKKKPTQEQRKMVDRVPSMCFEIAESSSTSASSTASVAKASATSSSDDGPSPMPMKKLIASRRDQSMKQVQQRPSAGWMSPLLPSITMMGGLFPTGTRPLMPPPRLPTHLAPGQILLRGKRI